MSTAAEWMAEVEVLLTLIAGDRPMTPLTLGEILHDGTRPETVAEAMRKILRRLIGKGMVDSPSWGLYLVTERGRIAAALEMAKDPALRAAFFDE